MLWQPRAETDSITKHLLIFIFSLSLSANVARVNGVCLLFIRIGGTFLPFLLLDTIYSFKHTHILIGHIWVS